MPVVVIPLLHNAFQAFGFQFRRIYVGAEASSLQLNSCTCNELKNEERSSNAEQVQEVQKPKHKRNRYKGR